MVGNVSWCEYAPEQTGVSSPARRRQPDDILPKNRPECRLPQIWCSDRAFTPIAVHSTCDNNTSTAPLMLACPMRNN